ncbi:hypothetical protein BDV41DRAFT_546518 [Aspergillus transmontanensis]|uniref:Uncharacterized protein n=1 Tax=Aspergillus transmontanensis TaxID=1034304 RepID=A0A5N6VMN1_9EURO|nr:hypothetical protein BDV41DRAFT_546518 [Aspergillus transmontanensis]
MGMVLFTGFVLGVCFKYSCWIQVNVLGFYVVLCMGEDIYPCWILRVDVSKKHRRLKRRIGHGFVVHLSGRGSIFIPILLFISFCHTGLLSNIGIYKSP